MRGQGMTREAAESAPPVVEQALPIATKLRAQAFRSALEKRAVKAPTYTVPETAALLSVSAEHLYRLIQADCFPTVRMGAAAGQGKFVVPAKAIEQLLDDAAAGGRLIEVAEWTASWNAERVGGAR